MDITMIAAHDLHNVIGIDDKIPWKLRTDMLRFKELTMGKPVIMGRKTYFSIPEKYRPLPGRKNIVMTRQDLYIEGVEIARSMKEALEHANGAEEVMIAGGGEIYELFLPYAINLRITLVDHIFEGDAFFPKIDPTNWIETKVESHKKDEKNSHDFAFIDYKRRNKSAA